MDSDKEFLSAKKFCSGKECKYLDSCMEKDKENYLDEASLCEYDYYNDLVHAEGYTTEEAREAVQEIKYKGKLILEGDING